MARGSASRRQVGTALPTRRLRDRRRRAAMVAIEISSFLTSQSLSEGWALRRVATDSSSTPICRRFASPATHVPRRRPAAYRSCDAATTQLMDSGCSTTDGSSRASRRRWTPVPVPIAVAADLCAGAPSPVQHESEHRRTDAVEPGERLGDVAPATHGRLARPRAHRRPSGRARPSRRRAGPEVRRRSRTRNEPRAP